MKYSAYSLQRLLLCAVVWALFGIFSATAMAQVTTSGLRVVVSDEAGNSVAGVRVRVTHLPTRRSRVMSSSAGGYRYSPWLTGRRAIPGRIC